MQVPFSLQLSFSCPFSVLRSFGSNPFLRSFTVYSFSLSSPFQCNRWTSSTNTVSDYSTSFVMSLCITNYLSAYTFLHLAFTTASHPLCVPLLMLSIIHSQKLLLTVLFPLNLLLLHLLLKQLVPSRLSFLRLPLRILFFLVPVTASLLACWTIYAGKFVVYGLGISTFNLSIFIATSPLTPSDISNVFVSFNLLFICLPYLLPMGILVCILLYHLCVFYCPFCTTFFSILLNFKLYSLSTHPSSNPPALFLNHRFISCTIQFPSSSYYFERLLLLRPSPPLQEQLM